MADIFNQDDTLPVEVNDAQEEAPEAPVAEEPAVQVEPERVVFVPQESFEGRINQTEYTFKKGVQVRCTRDEASIWVNAGKGYIK